MIGALTPPHLRMSRAYGTPRRACWFSRRPPLAIYVSPPPKERQSSFRHPAIVSDCILAHRRCKNKQPPATPVAQSGGPSRERLPVLDQIILIHMLKFDCKSCQVAMGASDRVARATRSRWEGGHVQGRSRRKGRGRPSAHGRHDGEACNQSATELLQPLSIRTMNTICVTIHIPFFLANLRAVDAHRPAPRPPPPPRRRPPLAPPRGRRRSCTGWRAVAAVY